MTGAPRLFSMMLAVILQVSAGSASAQLAPGSMDVQWSEGAEDCDASPPQAPIQVHEYNAQTYILRENLCSTFEAPFIFLLIGSSKALLIDTGAVSDPQEMPLSKTVMSLLPMIGAEKMPLLVLHTHRHLDHRAADSQFASLAGVQVVPVLLADLQRHLGFNRWPEEVVQLELGDRTIDVIPTPGHNSTHIALYDRMTGLFFSGDFLLPGRLLVEDTDEYLASARRVASFIQSRPVAHVLGAHIEMNRDEELFPWASTYHPRERALPLTKMDLLSLPETLQSFNGLYTKHGKWVVLNPKRQLIAMGAGFVLLLAAMVWLVRWYVRRRRAARAA